MTNRRPERDRPGVVGWRRGSSYRRIQVTLVEGRGLSSRQTQYVVRDRGLGNLSTPKSVQKLDERGWETGRCRMAQVAAPILDSTTKHHVVIRRCLLYPPKADILQRGRHVS
jgi:hypothetical protein